MQVLLEYQGLAADAAFGKQDMGMGVEVTAEDRVPWRIEGSEQRRCGTSGKAGGLQMSLAGPSTMGMKQLGLRDHSAGCFRPSREQSHTGPGPGSRTPDRRPDCTSGCNPRMVT